MWGHGGVHSWSVVVLLSLIQDLPIGLMDDIYDFITKFSTRVDEVEEVSGEDRHLSTLWNTAVLGILGRLHTAIHLVIPVTGTANLTCYPLYSGTSL